MTYNELVHIGLFFIAFCGYLFTTLLAGALLSGCDEDEDALILYAGFAGAIGYAITVVILYEV